jgi:O-antigen ligase
MLPISVALFFGSRNPLKKVIHAGCALVMMSGILLSYSRGAFLGMLVVLVFFAFRLAPGNRLTMVPLALAGAVALILLAPSGYGTRLLSIFVPGLDPGGSADSRLGELTRSLLVALRHPLLGVGMGNYQWFMSLKGLVTHNSYTQVAAEMGATALVLYTMFIVSPLRKLTVIAQDSFAARKKSDFYYLALGLQASLLAYMVSSFFLSVAFAWYVYYLVGYAVSFRRIYESETGKQITVESRRTRRQKSSAVAPPITGTDARVAA